MATAQDLEHLMARIQLRERAAFSERYSATSGKFFDVCRRVLRDRAKAEGALQEMFVEVWRRADRYHLTGHSPMT